MSELERLMAELCPDGVEYKSLGEIATDMYRGAGIKRDEITEEGTPCVRYGEIYTSYGIWFGKCISRTKSGIKTFSHGDILFAITGENVEEIAKSCAYMGDGECYAGGDIVVMKHKQNPKYMAYALSTTDAQSQKGKGRVKSKVVHSNIPSLQSIIIPLPPLPVQQEIVRILDSFTQLEAELETTLAVELEARERQYEHYQNKLLTFDKNVPHYSLEKLCEIVDYRGKTPKKVTEGVFLVTAKNIRAGYIDYDKSQEYIAPEDYQIVMRRGFPQIGDVLITTEAPCGNVAQVDREDIALAQRVIKYRPKTPDLNCSYLKHIMLGKEFQAKLLAAATGGTVKGIKGSRLHKLTIPLPPLEEQAHIVSVLDRFDALVNDITQGLPAEIDARRKQYAYYRDKLLSFKEKAS